MKIIILIIFFGLMAAPCYSLPDDELIEDEIEYYDDEEDYDPDHPPSTQKNMVITNPMMIIDLWSCWNAAYVRRLSYSSSVVAGLLYPNTKGVTGFGIYGEFRYYPFGNAFKRLYVAPRLAFFSLAFERKDEKALSFGGLAAWQFFLWKNIPVSLGFGLSYYSLVSEESLHKNVDGTKPIFVVEIGYAW